LEAVNGRRPQIADTSGRLAAIADDVTPELARAQDVHEATRVIQRSLLESGHGACPLRVLGRIDRILKIERRRLSQLQALTRSSPPIKRRVDIQTLQFLKLLIDVMLDGADEFDGIVIFSRFVVYKEKVSFRIIEGGGPETPRSGAASSVVLSAYLHNYI